MNSLIIILGIIVILLVYYIYTVINAVPRVANNVDLSKSAIIIPPTSISNPYSANYTISVWIYVFNFAQNNQIERFIMYGDSNFQGSNSYWSLRLDDTCTLYCDVLLNDETIGSVNILPNFPIQKWVNVVTTVASGNVQCFINGSFVTQQNFPSGLYTPTIPAGSNPTATFNFGSKGSYMDDGVTIRSDGSPIVINLLSRWDYQLAASDIYNNYNKGNGESTNVWGPAYHLNLNLAQGSNSYSFPIF